MSRVARQDYGAHLDNALLLLGIVLSRFRVYQVDPQATRLPSRCPSEQGLSYLGSPAGMYRSLGIALVLRFVCIIHTWHLLKAYQPQRKLTTLHSRKREVLDAGLRNIMKNQLGQKTQGEMEAGLSQGYIGT